MHDAEVDLALVGVAEGLVGLLDGMPGLLGTRVLALVGVEDHGEGLVLLLDFFLGSSGLQLEYVVGVVELLICEAVDLDIGLEALGLDGLVLDGFDLARIFGDLLTSLVFLLHSLLNIITGSLTPDLQVLHSLGYFFLGTVALHLALVESLRIEDVVFFC